MLRPLPNTWSPRRPLLTPFGYMLGGAIAARRGVKSGLRRMAGGKGGLPPPRSVLLRFVFSWPASVLRFVFSWPEPFFFFFLLLPLFFFCLSQAAGGLAAGGGRAGRPPQTAAEPAGAAQPAHAAGAPRRRAAAQGAPGAHGPSRAQSARPLFAARTLNDTGEPRVTVWLR